jgi:tRNA dimethylallyltransferase
VTEASIAGPGFINILLRTDALAGLLAKMDTPLLGIEPARVVIWRAAALLALLAAGFVDAVRALRARADLQPGLPSMRCVGYRQAWSYLDDLEAGKGGGVRRQRFVDEAIAATRQLAKRQLTWLRSMREREAVDCLAPGALERVSAIIAAHER